MDNSTKNLLSKIAIGGQITLEDRALALKLLLAEGDNENNNSKNYEITYFSGNDKCKTFLTPGEYNTVKMQIKESKIRAVKALMGFAGLGILEAKNAVEYGPNWTTTAPSISRK